MGAASSRGQWSSQLGFVLAAAGSAIGLGNIWRFPYVAGESGGGAFVLVYLVCVVLIALPVMLLEISLGRATQKNPVGAFLSVRPGTRWRYLGYLALLTGLGILYSAVVSHDPRRAFSYSINTHGLVSCEFKLNCFVLVVSHVVDARYDWQFLEVLKGIVCEAAHINVHQLPCVLGSLQPVMHH